MVMWSRVLLSLGAAALLAVPVVALAHGDSPPAVQYVPDPPAPTDLPAAADGPGGPGAPGVDNPPAPPAQLQFSGLITFSDPSGEAMGPDPLLWGEACHILSLGDGTYGNAFLNLTGGASEGRLEDLNLYAWDADGEEIARWDAPTTGLGVHHAAGLPNDAASVGVCLMGGARASYLLLVS